ncbi:MAG: hypothetical protein NC489_08640 [Ruminococcus flavefaciens]|nr:hypothetical protein [Ruminococcus flavefaciens]
MTLFEAMNICYDATDYAEYIEAYNVLNSIATPGSRVLKAAITKTDSVRFVDCVMDCGPIRLPAGTVLRHYSDVAGITELKSSFRSNDDCLYDSNRIYFWTDDSKNSDRRLDHCYEYVCDGSEVIYPDPEFLSIYAHDGKFPAVYMKADQAFSLAVTERN